MTGLGSSDRLLLSFLEICGGRGQERAKCPAHTCLPISNMKGFDMARCLDVSRMHLDNRESININSKSSVNTAILER